MSLLHRPPEIDMTFASRICDPTILPERDKGPADMGFRDPQICHRRYRVKAFAAEKFFEKCRAHAANQFIAIYAHAFALRLIRPF